MKNTLKNKHILFLINGLGMGNSTRCYSIIQQLVRRGFTVDVATSGNGLIFFREKSEVKNLYPMGSMYYGKSKDNKLNVFKTLLAVIPSLATFFRNGLTILRVCRETAPAAIIYDSQYNLFPVFFLAPK